MDRAGHHHRVDEAVIARLVALEAEVGDMRSVVATLARLAGPAIIRQAEIESRDLLTLKQAAGAAGVASEGTIRHWIKSRGLKATPVGTRRYVSKAAIAEFMAAVTSKGDRRAT